MKQEIKERYLTVTKHSTDIMENLKAKGLKHKGLNLEDLEQLLKYWEDSEYDGNVLMALIYSMYVEGFKNGANAEKQRQKRNQK